MIRYALLMISILCIAVSTVVMFVCFIVTVMYPQTAAMINVKFLNTLKVIDLSAILVVIFLYITTTNWRK